MNRSLVWRICCVVVLVITVLTFTTFVTPKGVAGPFLIGMPYTLWVGLLVTFILLAITIIGSLVHPGRDEPNS